MKSRCSGADQANELSRLEVGYKMGSRSRLPVVTSFSCQPHIIPCLDSFLDVSRLYIAPVFLSLASLQITNNRLCPVPSLTLIKRCSLTIRLPSHLAPSTLLAESSTVRKITTSADTVAGITILAHTNAMDIMAAAVGPFRLFAGPTAARLTKHYFVDRVKTLRYRCILHEDRPI